MLADDIDDIESLFDFVGYAHITACAQLGGLRDANP